jgi:hypothetical protein
MKTLVLTEFRGQFSRPNRLTPVGAFGGFWQMTLLVTQMDSELEVRWQAAGHSFGLAMLAAAGFWLLRPFNPSLLTLALPSKTSLKFNDLGGLQKAIENRSGSDLIPMSSRISRSGFRYFDMTLS